MEKLYTGVVNGTSKNVGLRKFCQDLEISEAFFFFFLYFNVGSVYDKSRSLFFSWFVFTFLSLETFSQRVSGSDF